MIIETQTKKWGNSIGIVIPRGAIEAGGIKPGERVVVEIQKKENPLRELFGALKFKRKTEEILKEVRKELEGRWLK